MILGLCNKQQLTHSRSTIKHTFTADERLKSKKLINRLFEQGKTLHLYPVRFIYLPCSAQVVTNHQALFVASKKKFKSTVVRNTIRRRLREAHRLHKYLLATRKSSSVYFLMGYIYISSDQKGNFQTIQKKVITAINHLKNIHEKAPLQ